MKLELVGFKICPFVQRVNIQIQHKAIPCTLSYLNPKELPEWLSVLSPLGKVPLLKVDDGALFAGEDFGLVDCAFAPFFMRLDLLEAAGAEPLTGDDLPRVARYRKAVVAVPAVKASIL